MEIIGKMGVPREMGEREAEVSGGRAAAMANPGVTIIF